VTEPDLSAPGTLNGWKEIAGYLGKSVRSAQRWEREIGLPVHRIRTPDGGQIIYASCPEIDLWRQQQAVLPPEPAVGDELPREGSPPTGETQQSISFKWRHWSAGLLLGMAIGAVAMFVVLASPQDAAVQFEAAGHEVRALTAANRTVWSYSFGRAVHRSPTSRTPAVQAELRDDGASNVFVPIRFAAAGAQSNESDAVVAFSNRGKLLWRVQPDVTFSDGRQTFHGPWHLRDIVVSHGVTPERVWVAYTHHTWRPGFVVEVTAEGEYSLRYVQEGATRALTYWPTPSGTYLVVGGAVNEYARASVALIGVDDPPAHAPRTMGPALACGGCPQGSVRALFLLAPSEILVALLRPYAEVSTIRPAGDGIRVSLDEGFGQGSVVQLGPDLRIKAYDRSDRYWQVHREMERDGRLTHAIEQCPEATAAKTIRLWTPTEGWTEYAVAPAVAPIIATHRL
jgi:hypothetical protein